MDKPDSTLKSAYDLYADQIYRFLYWQTGDALVAEDMTSEVFYRAWKHRDTFFDSNYRAWLYRVARNLVVDYYRKKKDVAMEEGFDPVQDYNLHHEAERHEQMAKVRSIIANLSPKYRSVVILRFFEQLSSKEVATIMNMSEANIRVLQYRALKELRGKLKNV